MTINLGPWTFDHIRYDEDADVAYLSIGLPRRAVGEETPEGHIALYDAESGEFCGVTIIGLRQILDDDGACVITLPSPAEEIPVDEALRDLVCA